MIVINRYSLIDLEYISAFFSFQQNMAKPQLVLIAVGASLLAITILSLLIASLGRLNTDESS